MGVVAGAGQPFGRNWAACRTCSRLQNVEEREAYRLLDLRIALYLDVRTCPEAVHVGPLLRDQTFPTGQARGGERGHDLIEERGARAQARPAIGDELDDAQPLARLQPSSDGDAHDIGVAF